MGELAVKAICDNIIHDANIKSSEIINDARLKASAIINKAQESARAYEKEVMAKANEEFNAEKKRLISASKMSAKNEILFAKQGIIEDILSLAKTRINNLPDTNYKKLLLSLICKSATELEASEPISVSLPQRAKKLISEREIKKILADKKILSVNFSNKSLSDVTIISKNIELTNGISEIIDKKRDALTGLICNVLLKEE